MNRFLIVLLFLLLIIAERQFFDSTIPCLEDDYVCEETDSDFKDDNETLERPDDEKEDGPDPFDDYFNLTV